MMFASKTPRDPEPYLDLSTGRRSATPPEPILLLVGKWVHLPREHFQYNEPNPILLDVRKVKAARGVTHRAAWRAFSEAYTYAHSYVTQDWVRITDRDILVHAYKVLSRLARLETNN